MIRSEILIRATANANWEAGDVVDIKPVGFEWGKKECEPHFKILRSNVPPKRGASEYVGDWAIEKIGRDGRLKRDLKARAKWRYDANKDVLFNKETGEERKIDQL